MKRQLLDDELRTLAEETTESIKRLWLARLHSAMGEAESPDSAEATTTFRRKVDHLCDLLTGKTRGRELRRARHLFERIYIDYIIGTCEGDKRKAARQLGISYSALKTKLRYPRLP
jgi:DNA-binding NtrC family response regulator